MPISNMPKGVMGGLLKLPSFLRRFPEIDVQNAPLSRQNHFSTIQGIAVASYNAGCMVGALATIFIGDILGRRRTISLGTVIKVIGASSQCSAFSLGHLLAGRVITGFGNGINTSTVSKIFGTVNAIACVLKYP
jgi:MFS family permease